MAKVNHALLSFNRGLVSATALARIDLKRMALSAETMTNWMPRALGSMMLRPGLKKIASSLNDAAALHIDFVAGVSDTAIIELTDSVMRIEIDETLLTRPSVTSAVTNGSFDSSLAGWTNADESGALSAWAAGGYMRLVGSKYARAIQRQTVTTVETGVEHALRVIVNSGVVTLRVGSASLGDEYIRETELGEGYHSLAFTPTGNFFIEVSNRETRPALLDSITVESAGVVQIPTPWAAADFPNIDWAQSADVIFVVCEDNQQRKIERRGTRSWSLSMYQPIDGPFRTQNTTAITLTPSAQTGDITLTASGPVFRSTHVGALFKIRSAGQRVSQTLTGANQFTDDIRVTGTGEDSRTFTIIRTGAFVGTIRIERSVEEPGAWVNYKDYTSASDADGDNIFDKLENQIIFYRAGFKTGEYTSGSATVTLTYPSGGIFGYVKITSVTSSTVAQATVLKTLGNTAPSDNWAESIWSDRRGWPTAIALYEGRLWQAGNDKILGSISDAYDSFDDEDQEGDAAPINRTIGTGPVQKINWLLPLARLGIGTAALEAFARSSSFDEPLSPTNFNIKAPVNYGSAKIRPIKIDSRGIFVDRSTRKLIELAYNVESNDFAPTDLTGLVPEIAGDGFTKIAYQRQPDTRIHCLREDGTVAIVVFDPTENVLCWVEFETDGLVEDIVVLPGTPEDKVYYHVNRTIQGQTKRYRERWAAESDCVGGTLNHQADSYIVYSGASSATITGLDHLEGETVVCWGNGAVVTGGVVSGGSVTLGSAITSGIIGLPYTARYKSVKLAYAGNQEGTPLLQRKRVDHLGLILRNTHYQGIKYGPDFENLDDMPATESETDVTANSIHSTYDEDAFEFSGTWDTDARVCLQATAPKPAQVLAAVIGYAQHSKA
jgi:hypothetical protein